MESSISVVSSKELLTLFGACDQHLRRIRNVLGVSITARDGRIQVTGPEPAVAESHRDSRTASGLCEPEWGGVAGRREPGVGGGAERAGPYRSSRRSTFFAPAGKFARGRPARPATWKPSGSTTSCCATGRRAPARPIWPWPWPLSALKRQAVRKIVLVRPAVEAGESLGFLPGDLQAKINPYLRPLLGCLARNDGSRFDRAATRKRT